MRSQGRRGTGKGVVFLARWPTSKAMQHARDRIRELTARRRLLLSVKWIVEDVNRFLRGWAAYFRYGNSARHFGKINGLRGCDWQGSSPNAIGAPGGSAGGLWRSPRPTSSA